MDSEVTGAVLCGFAVGWVMLAIFSVRFTDQPQRWAAAPAAFIGVGGLLLVLFGSPADKVLTWVWPPALLALVIRMFTRVRRQFRGRSKGWLIYPVLAMMALASIGGGYQQAKNVFEPRLDSPRRRPRNTRVCVYDRAGRGWSEPAGAADKPRATSPGAPGAYDILGRASALISTPARLGLGRLYALLEASACRSGPGRSPRAHREPKQPAQHHRRVHPGKRLNARSGITS